MLTFYSKYWVISNIDTVLFDKDGTFIDLHYFWGKMTVMRVCAVMEKYNIDDELYDKLCMFLGYDIDTCKMVPDGITALYSRPEIISIFKERLAEIGVQATVDELEKIFDDVSLEFNANIDEYTRPIEDAIKFIYDVRRKGAKVGIVTSDSEEATNLILKKFGWESLFDVVVGRESSQYSKESGALTKIALEELNANPVTTLMVGDAPMDSISAKNAGIEKTVLVSTGQLGKKELEEFSVYTVDSLKGLLCLNF